MYYLKTFSKRIACLFLVCVFVLSDISPLFATPLSLDKTVRVGYYYSSFFQNGQDDIERKSGYAYEYYQEIAKYTGWKYKYFYGSYTEMYDLLIKGKIDILADVYKTESREALMEFPENPCGTAETCIYFPFDDSSTDSKKPKSLDGKKIGVYADPAIVGDVRKFISGHNIKCSIVLYDFGEDFSQMFETGKIDCIAALDTYCGENFKPVFRLSDTDYYFAVARGRLDILEELNYAQTQILDKSPGYNSFLKNRYSKQNIVRTRLSDAESDYLKSHPVIRLGYRMNSMPYSDVDENGQMKGMIVDVVKMFEDSLGVKFELIPIRNNIGMVDALKNDEVDLTFPVVDDLWYAEKNGYVQTSPVVADKAAIFYIGDYLGEESYKKLGIIKGSPAQDLLFDKRGLVDSAIQFNSIVDCFDAIARGEIDGTILSHMTGKRLIAKEEKYKNISVSPLNDDINYSFAIKRGNVELYSLIEMAISQISNASIIESTNKNSVIHETYTFVQFIRRNIVMILSVIILLLTVLLLIFLSLYSRLKNQRQALSKAREDIAEISSEVIAKKLEAENDNLTGCLRRGPFEAHLKGVCEESLGYFVGFLDVDDFKNFNTEYGHDVGDQVLRFVSKYLKLCFSDSIIGRYGGDEFVFCTMSSDLARIEEQVNVFFDSINKGMNVRGENKVVSIRCSIGLVMVKNKKFTAEEVLKMADSAMYDAKNAGKNNLKVHFC